MIDHNPSSAARPKVSRPGGHPMDADQRIAVLQRLDEIPALVGTGQMVSEYSMHDPVGPLLLMEQRNNGRVVHHSVKDEVQLTQLLERILNDDPKTFVRVFRVEELTVTSRQEFRVELRLPAEPLTAPSGARAEVDAP